ncbi:unnamed protein product [Urochloa decumbens]|uniref:Pentatricopeptide repeat-containing protein n=1 Tax=Urochloa decumbens TaxID=240449 RepID=A0ABC8ZLV1_9POAL
MALYRRLLLLRRLSNLHPSPFPTPAIASSPPPTLAGPLAPMGCRHFAFSTAVEAAAERRRRKRRLRIEPPLNALRRGPPPPRDPNAPRLPDTISALVGPRLSFHNHVQPLIRSRDLDGASAAARAAVFSCVRPTVFTCNAIAAAMARAGRHDDAVALFEFFFRRSDIVPNIVSYNTLILAHCEAARVDDAMHVYRGMLASAPFSPSAVTFRQLTKGLVAARCIRDALDLLREMISRGAGADSLVYNNLIAGYIDLDDWDKAFELFNELTEKCVVYDGVVHTTFMEAYWKQGKDKEAMDNYQSLLQWGFKMTPATCNVLLQTLFKHGKHKEAIDLWQTMMDNHTPPSFIGINAESYNVMVNQCFKEGKFQEAIEVFHRQLRKNVQMDVGCFNNIIGKLCENGMLAEAEKLFEEMETKSVLPDVYTYTYLVDLCFKEGRVEDTMQYFYKMADGREHRPKFNIGFFNRMFEGLMQAGRVDDALKVYGRMPDKEIKPNAATFEILVKALCEEGDLDQARDLVVDMARRGVMPPQLFRESVVDIFKKSDRQEEIEKAFEEKPLPTPQPRIENQLRTKHHPRNAVGGAQAKQPGFSLAPPVQPGFGYSQPQQPAFKDTQNQQPAFDSSQQWHSGFGAQVQRPGYGAPWPVQAVVGSPQPPQSEFGASQGVQGITTIHHKWGVVPSCLSHDTVLYLAKTKYDLEIKYHRHRLHMWLPKAKLHMIHTGARMVIDHPKGKWGMQQSNFVARHGQTVVGTTEGESRLGGSYVQPRNDYSEGPSRFGAQMDHRYSHGYRPSYGMQGFAPHGECEAASKDQSETTSSEDRQRAAF